MNAIPPSIQNIATTCSLCHDQCVSACPIVEITRNQVAYPSRLAALAWELSRGSLEADPDVTHALQHCIHCGACTSSCVYVDHPVDVTPLVRWVRQYLIAHGQESAGMRSLLSRIAADGNPYGDVKPVSRSLKVAFPGVANPGGTLVLADASQLFYTPQSVFASLDLLASTGWEQISIADSQYLGWELWQYGYQEATATIARAVADEIDRSQPAAVIVLSPSSAYLLRQIFPEELGIQLSSPVLTLPEAVLSHLKQGCFSLTHAEQRAYLVLSCTEVHRLKSLAAVEVVERCGAVCLGFQENQPYRMVSYPEGIFLDLQPDLPAQLGRHLCEEIARTAPNRLICTSPFALHALNQMQTNLPAASWTSYVLEHIKLPSS